MASANSKRLRFRAMCRVNRLQEAVALGFAWWALYREQRSQDLVHWAQLCLSTRTTRALRTPLHTWRRVTRLGVKLRLYESVQAFECARMAFRRWYTLADTWRVDQLAQTVAAERAATAVLVRGFDRWNRWVRFERVVLSRCFYRESAVMKELLLRWRDEAKRRLAVRAFTYRTAAGTAPPPPGSYRIAPPSAFSSIRSFPISPPTWSRRSIDAFSSVSVSSQMHGGGRADATTGSLPTFTMHLPTGLPSPSPTRHRGEMRPPPSPHATASPIVRQKFLHLRPARFLLARWIIRYRTQALLTQLWDSAMTQRKRGALSLWYAAGTYLSMTAGVTLIAISHHVMVAYRQCFARWCDSRVGTLLHSTVDAWSAATQRRDGYSRAFLLWQRRSSFAGAQLIVAHRRKRRLRACAVVTWRCVTAFSLARAAVKDCRLKRELAEAMACWRDEADVKSAMTWMLLRTVAPRWRRRMVAAMQTWLLATQRTFEIAAPLAMVRRRRAMRCWTRVAVQRRRQRVAGIDLRSRCRSRDVRAAFDDLVAWRITENVKAMALIFCRRQAPLRTWRRLARTAKYGRAAAAAAVDHHLHLAWHAFRRRVCEGQQAARIFTAVSDAARAHSFISTWHLWRQRTRESNQRYYAEMGAADMFVRFVQNVMTTCALQVMHHWRAVAHRGVTAALMYSRGVQYADRGAVYTAVITMRMHARRRRKWALIRVSGIMGVREHRIAGAWSVWARQLRASAHGARVLKMATHKGDILRLVRMATALRKWHHSASRQVGDVLVRVAAAVRERQQLGGCLRRWHVARVARLKTIDRFKMAFYLASRAACKSRFGLWCIVSAHEAVMSAATIAARRSRQRRSFAGWRLRSSQETSRTEWLESSRAFAAIEVSRQRLRLAWQRWPRYRVPAVLRGSVAVMHAAVTAKRHAFHMWHAALATSQALTTTARGGFAKTRSRWLRASWTRWRRLTHVISSSLLTMSALAGMTRRRAQALRMSWDRWPKQPMPEAIPDTPGMCTRKDAYTWHRWGYADAMEAADAHVIGVRLRDGWRRWPLGGWLRAAMALAAVAHRRQLTWHRWARRATLTRSLEQRVLGHAVVVAHAAVRSCWRRWPDCRVANAPAAARSHFCAAIKRAYWSKWPRLRVPPKLSAAVAFAHDRVDKLRRGLLAWRHFQQRGQVDDVQRVIFTHHRTAAAWATFVFALNESQVTASIAAPAIACAARGACARGFEAWVSRCYPATFLERRNMRRALTRSSESAVFPRASESGVFFQPLQEDAFDPPTVAFETPVFQPRVAPIGAPVDSPIAARDALTTSIGLTMSMEPRGEVAELADEGDAYLLWNADADESGAAGVGSSLLVSSCGALTGEDAEVSEATVAANRHEHLAHVHPAHALMGGWGDGTLSRAGSDAQAASRPSTTAPPLTPVVTLPPAYSSLLSASTPGLGNTSSAPTIIRRRSSLMAVTLAMPAAVNDDPALRVMWPALKRWRRRAARAVELLSLSDAAALSIFHAHLFEGVTRMWRHAAARRAHVATVHAAHAAYVARWQRAALRCLLLAGRETWWRVRREKAITAAALTLRRTAVRMMTQWHEMARPLARATRRQRFGHRRATLRAAWLMWTGWSSALRDMAIGFLIIASRVGQRVALVSFRHWRVTARRLIVAHALLGVKERQLRLRALKWWARQARSNQTVDLLRWQQAAANTERQVRVVREAFGSWRHQGYLEGRMKLSDVQAILVGKYVDTGPRVDRCFATWRRVCVDELPGVMRQLLRVRRRMAEAEAAERRARQELSPESTYRLADPLF